MKRVSLVAVVGQKLEVEMLLLLCHVVNAMHCHSKVIFNFCLVALPEWSRPSHELEAG